MFDKKISDRAKRKLKKKQKNLQEQIKKQVQYSFQIIRDVQQRNLFYIFGDAIIDIDQLLSQDQVQFISSQNEFRKTVYVSRRKDLEVAESVLDMNVQGQTNLLPIVNLLKSQHNVELMHLSKMLEDYHNLINKNIDVNKYYHSKFQLIKEKNNQSSGNQWNYKKSLEKAYESINEMNEQCKKSNAFFGYIILQGNQFEQIKSIIGTPMVFLRDFMCLSDEQIDYMLLRNPILYPTVMENQFLIQTIRKLKGSNTNLDMFRQKPINITCNDIDVKSVDSFKVELFQEVYIQVLSNYTDKKDDIIYLFKLKPKSNLKAQEIIKNQRQLNKEQISALYSSSSNNITATDNSTNDSNIIPEYVDIRYQAQSEIFKEKYYSLVDNEAFHEIYEIL